MLSFKNATYVVKDGAIQLISLDEVDDERWFSRRMIDVSEILELIQVVDRERIGKPKPGSPIVERRLQYGGGGVFAIQSTGGGKFGGTGQAAKPTDETKSIKQLADAIVKSVRHSQPSVQLVPTLVTSESILIDAISGAVSEETWSNGSGRGQATITCVGGVLIVNAPEAVNDKVESFVEDLTFIMKAVADKKR